MIKIRSLLNEKTGLSRNLLVGLCVLVLALGMFGCEDPLEVENPNSLVEEDLSNPIASNALANGALTTVATGVAYVLAPYSTATDEVIWTGSRDAWRELDFGNVAFEGNEFTDNAMKFLHEGRWMADKAVSQLQAFADANVRELDRADLARAYLYSGVVRVYIADWFDDWAFSNKTEPAPNVGEANMITVYEDAVARLNSALDIARSIGNSELEIRALAMLARTKHAMAVWNLLNPKGQVPANPWVNAGKAEAEQALGLMGDDNYRWQFFYGPGAEWNDLAWQVNGRRELDLNAIPNDPIDGIADPRMTAAEADFRDITKYSGTNYSPVTIVSAREMRLIIAEAELASGNTDAARDQLNAIRALDGLTPITNEDVGEMLKHERRANLFLMGRRLADMYRFGLKDPMWQTTSHAYTTPGTFLPITIAELQSNPLIRR